MRRYLGRRFRGGRTVSTGDLRTVALVLHVVAGAIALVLAGRVMLAGTRQDWSTRWGGAYVGCVVLVAGSAVVLAGPGSTLPTGVRGVLLAVALATAAAAVRGLQLAHGAATPPRASRPVQLRLMWGTVTSLVSAVAVVSGPVAVWAPVVIAGTVLTERGYRRARRDPAWA